MRKSIVVGLSWFERLYRRITGDHINDEVLITLYIDGYPDTIVYILKKTECGQRFCEMYVSGYCFLGDPIDSLLYRKVIWPWLQGDNKVLLNYLKEKNMDISKSVYFDAGIYSKQELS